MKCESLTKYILLESSGELSPADRARLDAHVAGCPTCKSYRSALIHLGEEVRADDETVPASRVTATSLLVEARRREERETAARHAWFGLGSRPALAFAAAAVVAFALGFGAVMMARPGAPAVARTPVSGPVWADEWVDVRLDLLSDEMAMAAEEMDSGLALEPESSGETVDEIAARILQMEA
ncbi:MAG: zf-HC2 domain-containing protein [Verrucomicrobia bacterium]|nr:zf-HC2 domain-containing protein [Verrucomicrobiota bacterium]